MNLSAINLDVNEVHVFNIWENIESSYRINRFDKRYLNALYHIDKVYTNGFYGTLTTIKCPPELL